VPTSQRHTFPSSPPQAANCFRAPLLLLFPLLLPLLLLLLLLLLLPLPPPPGAPPRGPMPLRNTAEAQNLALLCPRMVRMRREEMGSHRRSAESKEAVRMYLSLGAHLSEPKGGTPSS
jgi:hypothetical protein